MKPRTDACLAGRARRGDLGALALLLARWQDPMLRYCRRFTVSTEDAMEVEISLNVKHIVGENMASVLSTKL